jgi:hypothetical protein
LARCTREQTSQTAAVLCLLETLLERWPESDRPSLDGLSRRWKSVWQAPVGWMA